MPREPTITATDATLEAGAAAGLFDDRYRPDFVIKRGLGIETWAGTDEVTHEPVIIKSTRTSRVPPGVQYTLEHDARVLRTLDDPHIAGPLSVGITYDETHVVRRRVPGETLAERLTRAPLNVEEWIVVARTMLSALAAAHDAGILHRDVTPDNIIVNERGPVTDVTLVDFGLARGTQRGAVLSDRPSSVARYVSPEQAGIIGRDTDHRSDLYSLGAVLFECIAGEPAFEGRDIAHLLRSHMSEARPALRERGYDVPRTLDEIIGRLLMKDPHDRYQAAAAALEDVLELERRLASPDSDLDAEFVIGMHDRRTSLVEPIFIGRSDELAAVQTAIHRSTIAGRQLVHVEAVSGGGKTRMLDELASRLVPRGISTYRGSGSDEAAQRPYELMRGVFEEILRAAVSDVVFARGLRSRCARHASAICEAFPMLTPVLLTDAELAVREQLGAEEFGQQRSLDALSALLDALGTEERPAVIVLDDMHWADDLSLALIRNWHGRREPGRGVTVIGAFRSDEVGAESPVRALAPDTTLFLAPLSSTEVRHVVESMAGAVPSEVTDLIVELAEGNPFLVTAVLRGLVEAGALVNEPQGWAVDLDAMEHARSSKRAADIIDQRIVRLPAAAFDILAAGAILGKQFDVGMAAELAGMPPDEAFTALEVARRQHIMWGPADDGTCTFVHDKLRDGLLERIEPDSRRTLHQRAGAMIERTMPNSVFEIAYHYHEGGQDTRAFPFAITAARRARGQHSLAVARYNYEIAELGAPDGDRRVRFEIASGLGAVYALSGRYDDADAHYERAFEFAATPSERAEVDARLGELAFRRGDVGASEIALERSARLLGLMIPRSTAGYVIAMLGQLVVQVVHSLGGTRRFGHRGPPPAITQQQIAIFSRLAYTYWFGRGAVPCLWAHLREMNLAERYGPSPSLGQAWSEHGPAMSMLPWTSRGLRYVEHSLQIRRDLNDVWGQGQTYHFAGVLYYAASRFQETIDSCRRSIGLLERTGDRWELNAAGWQMALAAYRLGDLRGAARIARGVYESALEIGDVQASVSAVGVWAKATDGDIPEEIDTELLRRQAHASGDVATVAQSAQAHAIRAMRHGRFDEALDALEEAQRMVSDRGARQENVVTLLPWIATARRRRAQAIELDQASRSRQLRTARVAARRARRLARLYRNNLPHALRECAYVDALTGHPRRALRHIQRSIEVAQSQGARHEEALSLNARGHIGVEAGWPGAHDDCAQGEALLAQLAVPQSSGLDADAESLSLVVRFEQLIDSGRAITASSTEAEVHANLRTGGERLLQTETCAVLRATDPARPWVDMEVVSADGSSPIQPSTALLERAFEQRRAVVYGADDQARDLALTNGDHPVVRSALCVPIYAFGHPRGCLYASDEHVDGLFGAQEMRLADYLSALTGAALENAGNLSGLRELSQSLERRVTERTDQLARANRELDASLAAQRSALVQARDDARRLEEALRIKDRFVSMVSHELRTPLTSIIGFSDTLLEDSVELAPQQQAEFLAIVQAQAHRLGRLVDELLTFSRIQRGAVQPLRRPTPLLATIRDVITELNLDAAVTVDCPEQLTIPMSSDHVTQVLTNLLSNADRYGESPFEVVGRERDGFVELCVSDHGEGVSADFVPQLFAEFTRDQRSPAATGPGFGLGLSIVVALATTYGGDVTYQPVDPHGASFVVRIPRDGAPTGETRPTSGTPERTSQRP